MNKNYWVSFWQEYTSSLENADAQAEVLRTWEKQPISEELWEYTLAKVEDHLMLPSNGSLLDLCAGNGLIARFFASKGASVTAVDVASPLLERVKDVDRITAICSDVRDVTFNEGTFDRVILYAGVQYFSYRETIELLQKVFRWLKPGGRLYIGDIPDANRQWTFFDTPERQGVYFENKLAGKAIVGTWFRFSWLEKLASYVGFSETQFIEQDKEIYAKFRFDMLCLKS